MRPRRAPAGSDRDELDVDPGGLGQGVQVSGIGGEDFIAAPGLPPSFTGIDDTPGMKRPGQQRGAPEQPECDLSCHGTHGLASAPTRLATATLVVNSGLCGEAEFEACQVAGSLPVQRGAGPVGVQPEEVERAGHVDVVEAGFR